MLIASLLPSIGEAFVQFKTESEAVRAQDNLNKKTIMGRWIDLYQVLTHHFYQRNEVLVIAISQQWPP